VPVQTGYQEAHGIYDEMRQFFAQKAMSNGEVVVIKVTMMLLKPGSKNPSVVLVRTWDKPESSTSLITAVHRTY
jgi:hypothetical protein